MGVSIFLKGKSITPGWRSMMFDLLYENFQSVVPADGERRFLLFKSDLPQLRAVKKKQRKGDKEPPFDWSDDIADSFDKIISEIKKNGEAQVDCRF